MSDSEERILAVMGRHPFTTQYSAEEEARLAKICTQVEFQPGEYLLKEDVVVDHFYLITRGLVCVELRMQGGEQLRMQTEGTGGTMGWSWLFPPYRSQFDIRALEPTKTISIDAQKMRAMMEEDPLFAYRTTYQILSTVIEGLSQSRLQLLDIYSMMEKRQ
jgi:CRP/FNR family cyclic AMP-dependent transcriptional regulator